MKRFIFIFLLSLSWHLLSFGCVKPPATPPPRMPGNSTTLYQSFDPSELEYWEDNVAFADTTSEANDRTTPKANEDPDDPDNTRGD